MAKRIVSFTLMLLVMCSLFATFATAANVEPYSLNAMGCPNCGTSMAKRTVIYTFEKNGSCPHGTHYSAERVTRWVCDTCQYYYDISVESGHYCTGEGGHYCWSSCSC